MGQHGVMGKRVSTCVYIDREVIETDRKLGLNVSRVSENVLKEAVSKSLKKKGER
jgi:post-segregation antitoxin (ccd killing protein)